MKEGIQTLNQNKRMSHKIRTDAGEFIQFLVGSHRSRRLLLLSERGCSCIANEGTGIQKVFCQVTSTVRWFLCTKTQGKGFDLSVLIATRLNGPRFEEGPSTPADYTGQPLLFWYIIIIRTIRVF